MATKSTRPRDPNQLAKLIVDIASGDVQDPTSAEKRSTEPKQGQAGGLKGGVARAAKLDPERRSEIAKAASEARWGK